MARVVAEPDEDPRGVVPPAGFGHVRQLLQGVELGFGLVAAARGGPSGRRVADRGQRGRAVVVSRRDRRSVLERVVVRRWQSEARRGLTLAAGSEVLVVAGPEARL